MYCRVRCCNTSRNTCVSFASHFLRAYVWGSPKHPQCNLLRRVKQRSSVIEQIKCESPLNWRKSCDSPGRSAVLVDADDESSTKKELSQLRARLERAITDLNILLLSNDTNTDICFRNWQKSGSTELASFPISAAEQPRSAPACAYTETQQGHKWECFLWHVGNAFLTADNHYK